MPSPGLISGLLPAAAGAADVALFLIGAGFLVALAKLWVPALRPLAAGGYVLLSFVLFAPALVTSRNQVPLDTVYGFSPWAETLEQPVPPQNPVLADVVLQMVPFRHLVRERLLEGSVPLWSHELGTGQPLLGNAQSAPFAPLHLMALPLPPVRAMTVTAAWQILVALLGAHLLLLELGASWRGAALAALAFSLSTYSFAWLYYPLGMASSWMPAVLLAIVQVLRDRPRAWVALGLAAAALALSGHPTAIVHSAVLASLVLAAGIVFGGVISRRRVLGQAILAATLAVACTAPMLGPVLEALPHGERAVGVRRVAELASASAPAPPRDSGGKERDCRIRTLLHPFACGSPRDGNWSGRANFSEVATYAGWITLAVGIAGGLLLPGVPRYSLLFGFAILIFAVKTSWFFGSGGDSVFAGALHGRARVFWILALAVSAGASLDRLLARQAGRWLLGALLLCGAVLAHALAPPAETAWQGAWRWAVGLGLLGAAVALAVPSWRRRLPLLVLPLLAADLALAGARYNPLSPAELDLSPPQVVRFLRGRVESSPPFRVHAVGARFQPYLPAVYGLWDPRGFDPMRPGEAAWILRQRIAGGKLGGQFLQGPTIDAPLLSFLAVRYLVAGSESLPPPWRPVFDGVGGRVWENPAVLDVFFVPEEAEPAAQRQEALRYAATTARLAERALVEGIATGRRGQRGRARLVGTESNRLRLELSGPPGTVFASSVTWMPGWRYDRTAVRLVRVNGAFLGLVKTAPGDLVTELRYSPTGWLAGLATSGTLIVFLCLRLLIRRRRGLAPEG